MLSSPRARIGLIASLAVAALLTALGPPLLRAWRCVERVEGTPVAEAEVREIVDGVLVLSIEDGPEGATGCTVSSFGRVEIGGRYDVHVLADGSGRCELVATVENSRLLLNAIGALTVALLLAFALAAVWIDRLASARAAPTTHFERSATCPRCGKPMEEGTLVPMAGVHWRRKGERVGLPSVLGGLPGTVSFKGRPQLHAFRCDPCGVATFRYRQG